MTGIAHPPSKRVSHAPVPNTQVSSRNDIFNQNEEQVDPEALQEDAKRMDMLMRQLMGGDDDEDEKQDDAMEEQSEQGEQVEEEAFSFRLFSNQTVATVKIGDEKDDTDHWSKIIADQQVYEFDETDPELLARVKQAVVDYDTILKQSTTPYPALQLPHRVLHISSKEVTNKSMKKKRKSKKCRDFEKAVKEGKIVLKTNMRKSEDGWPGWPGNLTRVAIVDYQSPRKSSGGGGRGGASMGRGGYSSNSSFRGGRGGHSRGGSRGGSFSSKGGGRGGRGKSF